MKVVVVVAAERSDLMEADFLPRIAARTTLLERLRAARTIREVEAPGMTAVVGVSARRYDQVPTVAHPGELGTLPIEHLCTVGRRAAWHGERRQRSDRHRGRGQDRRRKNLWFALYESSLYFLYSRTLPAGLVRLYIT